MAKRKVSSIEELEQSFKKLKMQDQKLNEDKHGFGEQMQKQPKHKLAKEEESQEQIVKKQKVDDQELSEEKPVLVEPVLLEEQSSVNYTILSDTCSHFETLGVENVGILKMIYKGRNVSTYRGLQKRITLETIQVIVHDLGPLLMMDSQDDIQRQLDCR